MALPKIAPYPMPGPTELPTNRVDWVVDPARAVLLVHDLQNYFLSAFTPDASPVTELLANVARLKDDCGRLGVPVVYSAQPGGQTAEQRGLQKDFWGPGLPDDPHEAAIAPAVAPGPADTVLTKWKYSAFVRTELGEWMRELGRDQLVLVGVYAHIGVMTTACDAWMQDIQAFVVADAVADFTSDNHRMALRWAAANCAVVTDTESLFTGKRTDMALTLEVIRTDVADILGEDPADIPDDENLVDYGLDSVRVMALVERWTREHGVTVDFADLAERPTLEGWAELLSPER